MGKIINTIWDIIKSFWWVFAIALGAGLIPVFFEWLFRKLTKKRLQQGGQRKGVPRDIQRAVYKRDGGKCVYCGNRRNLEFDHIIPLAKGGSNTIKNLQILCQKCNRQKSSGF